MNNQNNNQPAEEQSTEVTETDIMQMLHKKKMAVIEKKFQEKEKGLTIEEFLKVMLQHLDYNKSSKEDHLKITLALIELFKEIDVNGDGTMEWDQFSNHIIELGLLRNDRSFKNLIKNYYPSETMVDKEKHDNALQNVYYFEKLKYLFSVEKDSSRFKVYSAQNSNLLYEVNAHQGSILTIEHLAAQNLIATSSNDLTINFWDATSFTLKQIVSVPEIQLCVRYADWKSSHTQLLYTGGSDSIIHIYDASTLKEKGTMSGWNPFFKSDSQQYGHSSPIGDILPIDSQQTLVTAGYDGNICLWDSVTHLPKKQLRGHDKGVYSLDWCDWSQMNQCVLSAGLDHEAFVWNTYVKEKIFLLRGHNHPLVGVKCLPESPQIVTTDISGMVKIWDVRNFLCVQTFNVPTEEVNSFCLTYSTTPGQQMKKRIICASKKMHFYEYDEPKDQFLTDEKICLRVIFNQVLLVFVTLHPDCLKVWCAKEGRLQSVYRALSSAELTTAVLDYRCRKLFVGDVDGSIFTVNIKNGARMKSFQSHNSMITGLCHWTMDYSQFEDERGQDQRRLISISKDTEVFIHDEDTPEDAQSSCRYVMKQHKDSVNAVVIIEGSETLASASDDGNVILTNLVSYRQEILPKVGEVEMKKLTFLGSHNCLVACDANGKIAFYAVGQTRHKNKILFTSEYKTLSLTKKQEVFPVTAIAYDDYNNLLLIGDEFGNIQGWDLSDLIKILDACKLQEKKRPKKRKDTMEMQSELDSPSFITSMASKPAHVDISEFTPKLIRTLFQIKRAHTDGITHIQVMGKYHAFASSSFDCCCYVWSLKNFKKLGSLIIGGDRYWGLKFDLHQRKRQAVDEANHILTKLEKGGDAVESDEDEAAVQERKKQVFNTRKEQSLNYAKSLIERQRKMGGDSRKEMAKFVDPLEQAERMEREMFMEEDRIENPDSDEDEGNNYHLLGDVVDYKKRVLNNAKKNTTNSRKNTNTKGSSR